MMHRFFGGTIILNRYYFLFDSVRKNTLETQIFKNVSFLKFPNLLNKLQDSLRNAINFFAVYDRKRFWKQIATLAQLVERRIRNA